MGQRRQVRGLSSALLIVSGLLGWPMPPVKAGGVVSGELGLVSQARAGAVEVSAEVKAWRQQVQTLYQQGRFREAIPLQEHDLAWTVRIYGPDHPSTATSLNNLALLYNS